jgi:hypothetical protein
MTTQVPDYLIDHVPDGYSGLYILEITWPNNAADRQGSKSPFDLLAGKSTVDDEDSWRNKAMTPTFWPPPVRFVIVPELRHQSGGLFSRSPQVFAYF